MSFRAFKEWRAVVEALGAGDQILILRKGGISEDGDGFSVASHRFWLFPTLFHAQREKLKPAAAKWFPPAPPDGPPASAAPTASSVSPSAANADVASAPSPGPGRPPPPPPGHVELTFFAEVARTAFLSDWPSVARLDPFHGWTEATIRDRFDWGSPAGIHVIAVRVHRLERPVHLPLLPDMGGCKSWIDLPVNPAETPARPVLADAVFARRLAAISL